MRKYDFSIAVNRIKITALKTLNENKLINYSSELKNCG